MQFFNQNRFSEKLRFFGNKIISDTRAIAKALAQ